VVKEIYMAAAALTVGSMGLSIFQGIQQKNAADAQAQTTRKYADMQMAEHYREATRIEDEGRRFAANQKMMYIGSGVEVGGSAVVTLAQTNRWAKAEADAKRSRGQALREYGYETGRIQEGQGRAALVGGFMNAAKTGYSYADAKGWGSGGGSNDPYKTGRNPATFKQLSRPGATTRIKP